MHENIITKWNKPGSKYVFVEGEKGGWTKEKTGKSMAMVFVIVDGKKVTRHVEV